MSKNIVLLLSLSVASLLAACNSGSTTSGTAVDPNETYCVASGGTVVSMTAEFDTYDGQVNGITKKFCQKISGNPEWKNVAYVGLETLSTQPTIAATYIKKLVLTESSIIPTSPYANPSLNVCEALHGSEIGFSVLGGGFTDNLGQSDICIFGDGSSISAWTLIYAGYDVRNDVESMIRSIPLNIDIPSFESSIIESASSK